MSRNYKADEGSGPYLDLSRPITGGRDGGDHGVERGAHTRVFVSVQRLQAPRALIVVEVHRTRRTTRDQHASVCGEPTMHRETLHLQPMRREISVT